MKHHSSQAIICHLPISFSQVFVKDYMLRIDLSCMTFLSSYDFFFFFGLGKGDKT